jgi:hypothetical protein
MTSVIKKIYLALFQSSKKSTIKKKSAKKNIKKATKATKKNKKRK